MHHIMAPCTTHRRNEDLSHAGVITKSMSPLASPIVQGAQYWFFPLTMQTALFCITGVRWFGERL